MNIDLNKLLKDEATKNSSIKEGQEVEGEILNIDKNRIYVDLSPWGTGMIYKSDLSTRYNSSNDILIGKKVKANIFSLENKEGFIELSFEELNKRDAFVKIENLKDSKKIVSAKVVGANKGGLMMEFEGLKGFLPSSQLSTEHYPRSSGGDSNEILSKLQDLVGKNLNVRVLNKDKDGQNVVFSEKAAKENDTKKMISKYKIGDVIDGKVSGVVDFGIFISFDNNLEGLAHISELDWQIIKDPKEFFKVGDKVKAKIIGIKNNDINFSLRALKDDPWKDIDKKYKIGEIYEGAVKEIHPFGAFVFLDDKIHGLVHISQFGSISNIKKQLSEGKKYNFKIASIEKSEHRMALQLVIKDEPKPKTKTKPKSKPKKQ
ncbi:MAG: S1 RNA-binding domain-containing protein [Patescibacteria group bacterium]